VEVQSSQQIGAMFHRDGALTQQIGAMFHRGGAMTQQIGANIGA
jgi:hypothetical protein